MRTYNLTVTAYQIEVLKDSLRSTFAAAERLLLANLLEQVAIQDVHHEIEERCHAEFLASGKLTIGSLFDKLRQANDLFLPVCFDNGRSVDGGDSYRGSYRQFALHPGNEMSPVRDVEEMLQAAIGRTFGGWHGGEYAMDRDTPVWMAEHGCCGDKITGVRVEADKVVILTKAGD